MMDTVFEANNLSLRYGNKPVLFDVNMKILEKQVTAFIGPSGCGKSTFLRCFNRMNDLIRDCKIEGTLSFKGKDVLSYEPMVLRTLVGMVFQSPSPFPMSIFDNVAYGPRMGGVKKKETLLAIVEESLKKAALWEEVKDRLRESALSLSGGEQQRLCIARALAMEPEALLMDEPTSALDPIATLKIESLISELKKNYTIIIVTHNMQQAARISDYTAFFLLGKVIEFAPTEELFQRPKEKKTEEYITGRFG